MLDGAGRATASLDGLDDADGGGVTRDNLAEDDVATVQPAGDDGGDEELGAVAVGRRRVSGQETARDKTREMQV